MRRLDEWWAIAAFVLVLALLVIVGVHDCRAQQRCEALGGRVERYDCATSYTTTSCGSGCWTTTPITSCKWRCVGAPVEQRP